VCEEAFPLACNSDHDNIANEHRLINGTLKEHKDHNNSSQQNDKIEYFNWHQDSSPFFICRICRNGINLNKGFVEFAPSQ
jgi:hypothetical protein